MNEQVTAYINEATAEQKLIMEMLRQLIHDTVPQVVENFKWSRPIFSTNKDFAYLKTAKNYVTLGFFQFKKLNDPQNLLEGTGKDMRHIKIKKASDIDKNVLTEWFASLTT